MLSLEGRLAARLRNPRLIRSWAIWFPGSPGEGLRPDPQAPSPARVHGTAPRPHPCTCVWISRDTCLLPLRLVPLGASCWADKLEEASFPQQGEPRSSCHHPLSLHGGGEGLNRRWRFPQGQGTALSRFPPHFAAASQLFLPNKTRRESSEGLQTPGPQRPPTRFALFPNQRSELGGPQPATSASFQDQHLHPV